MIKAISSDAKKTSQLLVKALLFLVILLFIGASAARALTPRAIAKKALRSTVLLVMEDAHGQPLRFGSGFFVHGGAIASSLHAVEGIASDPQWADQTDDEKVELRSAYHELVREFEREFYMARLMLPLGNSDTIQVGDSVYAVGNPRGLEGTFSQGIVSRIRKVGSDKILQITARISPGNSGGPVLRISSTITGTKISQRSLSSAGFYEQFQVGNIGYSRI